MGRPRKNGLDYFQHDVNAANDEKIEAMRALYGNDGYAFYFILLERIYKNSGVLDVQNPAIKAAIQRSVTNDAALFEKMMQTALDLGLFDVGSYQGQNRLTSKAIERQIGFVNNERERKRAYTGAKRVLDVQNPATTPDIPPIEQNRIEQNSIPPISPKGELYSGPFLKFWEAYPRKVAKGDAQKAFKKLSPDSGLLDTMLRAIEKQRSSKDWKRDGGQYIPHPATWLNQRRWEDEQSQAENSSDGWSYLEL